MLEPFPSRNVVCAWARVVATSLIYLFQAVKARVLHVPVKPALGEARREVVERRVLLASNEVERAGRT